MPMLSTAHVRNVANSIFPFMNKYVPRGSVTSNVDESVFKPAAEKNQQLRHHSSVVSR